MLIYDTKAAISLVKRTRTKMEKFAAQQQLKLANIQNKTHPSDAQLERMSAYKRQLSDVSLYLNELHEIIGFVSEDITVAITNTFEEYEDEIDASDESLVSFEGEYVHIALIQSFPKPDTYIIWLHDSKPLTRLREGYLCT